MAESPLKQQFPLHWAVFVDNTIELQEILNDKSKNVEIDKLDVRGRTPLMLAVSLGHKECSYILLRAGANADAVNSEMWSVSHEAIAFRDPTLLLEIIKYRDYQRNQKAAQAAKKFLSMLAKTRDFYCEMSWDFSSWLPFVSRICPSDTYKIYKQGSRVRIDTTLLAFEGTSWKRGDQSFIFSLENDVPVVIILDHAASTASKQALTAEETLESFIPTMADIEHRLKSPTSATYIDIDKIGFERSKSNGILSWISSSDRRETIDGYETKVFDASSVNLITKIRVDHLNGEEKAKLKQSESSHSLQSLMSFIRSENTEIIPAQDVHQTGLAASEYLDAEFPLEQNIGKKQEVQKKINSFKATLWLAERYPLDLQEQILPIVELMSSSSAHFARLQNFMRMQLPSGFPVKIEIPLFHVISAKIQFGNINAPGPFVTPIETGTNFKVNSVTIADSVFEIPASYKNIDELSWWPDELGDEPHRTPRYPSVQDHEEMLLKMAIQQSLRETGSNTQQSASGTEDYNLPGYYDLADEDLARAIEESLRISGESSRPAVFIEEEDELTRAIRLSKEESERTVQEEVAADEELQKVLALSLLEK